VRIEWATLCRGVDITADGTNVAGIGIDKFEVATFPAVVPMQAALFLAVGYHELHAAEPWVLLARAAAIE
jgi:hypothetical protein